MPSLHTWDTYVEPMVGGGAVFFRLTAEERLFGKSVVLADASEDIITLYRAVYEDAPGLLTELDAIVRGHRAPRTRQGVERYYYAQRAAWNDGARTPARQLYLRYAGYNGLWRISASGKHNTPWNQEVDVRLPPEEWFYDAAVALERATLLHADFRKVPIPSRSLVYFDPPYDAVRRDGKKNPGFVAYTREGFSDTDQEDLIKVAAAAVAAGSTVVYSNANTPLIRELLARHWPTGAIYNVTNQRAISCQAEGRGDVRELLVIGEPR